MAQCGSYGALTAIAWPSSFEIVTLRDPSGWVTVSTVPLVTISAFVAVAGLALFLVLKKVDMLRVVRDAELFGVDIALHKTYAYPEEMVENQFS